MSSNLLLVCRSRRVVPFLLNFSMYGRGGRQLEINIPLQQICAKRKEGGYNRRGRNVKRVWYWINVN